MLRVAEIVHVDPDAIKAVAKELCNIGPSTPFNALPGICTDAPGVMRIKGRSKTHLFLLSDDFKEDLPLFGDLGIGNWTGECPS